MDCLSPINQNHIFTDMFIHNEVSSSHIDSFLKISSLTLTADALVQETVIDRVLNQIQQNIINKSNHRITEHP